ncbi:MAG TPA: hypothetical protein VK778_07685 [Solirubrobacteraceae bacterium]|jgi:hypothetical protein|nr:hypothetical protein [Solirubrobacteraceae bacterium]
MISSEVQRTLVKSPPELWAELSDPDALARHLGELGEVRIVRTEPESTVEWAAEDTTGTVSIKPSGWGTKVTLSVIREISAEPAVETDATIEQAPGAEPEAGAEPLEMPTTETEAVPEPEETPVAEPQPTAKLASEPRRGFFARVFGRRRRAEATESSEATAAPELSGDPPAEQEADTSAPMRSPEQPDAFAAVREALAPETFATAHPFAALPDVKPTPEPPPPTTTTTTEVVEATAGDTRAEPVGDISAELMAAEEVAEEEVTAVLTAVLDRLGAAHHRPFSRS